MTSVSISSFMLIALASILVSGQSFLNFDKESLTLSGSSVSEKINVSLKEKPNDEVVVYFEGLNTRFDKCSLNFTPDNFDKPQPLSVVSVPFNSKASAPRQIPIKFTAFAEDCGSKCHGKRQDFPTTRTPDGCGQCRVTGDPHYKMFDQRQLLNYQGIGDFYLVKSDSIVIQARQGKCAKRASCVHALAVQYGGASFIIDSNDPNPDVCVKTITNLDGVIISKTRSGRMTTVNVAFNAGSSMKVDIIGSGAARFMNVYIDLANHLQGKVNGLCGRFDGVASNDFSSPNGDQFTAEEVLKQSRSDKFNTSPSFSQSPLFRYGEAWRVASNENLFVCKDKCTLPNKAPAIDFPVSECKIPDQPKCVPRQPILTPSITPAPTPPQVPVVTVPASENPVATTFTSTSSTVDVPTQTPTISSPPAPPAPSVQPPSPPQQPRQCPTPIYQVPVPPGYRREKDVPRYVEEPRKPEYADLPDAPKDESDKNKKFCSLKITAIDQCDEDISVYISMCETDVEAQVNPEVACNAHRDAYAAVCARNVLDKAKDTDPKVCKPAIESAKKHCFGNIQCDAQCKQCGERGCLECNDPNAFEVQAGRCVPKQKIEFDTKCYPPLPTLRALLPSEIAPKGLDPASISLDGSINLSANPLSQVQTDSVRNAVSEFFNQQTQPNQQPPAGGSTGTPLGNSATYSNLSLMAVFVAVLVSIVTQI